MAFESLSADTIGEIEKDDKVLVVKRIKQVFHITASEEDRETIERVLGVYADSCPVARSIMPAIEVTSELEFTPA